jgi:hypothetical protein
MVLRSLRDDGGGCQEKSLEAQSLHERPWVEPQHHQKKKQVKLQSLEGNTGQERQASFNLGGPEAGPCHLL